MANSEWTSTDSMVLQILANVLAGQNREGQAADLLEYVLLREPDNSDALRALAAVYLMTDRYDDALAAIRKYEAAVPAATTDADVLLVKGQSLWELGHSKDAIQIMRQYFERRTGT